MASLFNIYRPKNFDEVVGQAATVKLLRQQALTGKFKQTYIFAGHFGSGKTSMARIFAMALNCSCRDEKGNPCGVCDSCRSIIEGRNPDVIEYAASEQTGVEGADKLIASTQYAPIGKYKVYIIDEVQALSAQAFQRLLKITEEPPKNCVFIFCTTEFDSIPVANRSRMQKYNFNQFTNAEIAGRVRYVAKDAGLSIDEDVPEVIAKYSEASMRNAIVMLETAAEEGHVTGEMVEEIVGVAKSDRIFEIIQAVADNDVKALSEYFSVLRQGGFNIPALIKEIIAAVADLLTWHTSRVCEGTYRYRELVEKTDITPQRLIEISEMLIKIKGMKAINADVIFLGFMSLIRSCQDTKVAKPVVPEAEEREPVFVPVKDEMVEEVKEVKVVTEKPADKPEKKKVKKASSEEKKAESKKEKEEESCSDNPFDNPFDSPFDSPFGLFADDTPSETAEVKVTEEKAAEPEVVEPEEAKTLDVSEEVSVEILPNRKKRFIRDGIDVELRDLRADEQETFRLRLLDARQSKKVLTDEIGRYVSGSGVYDTTIDGVYGSYDYECRIYLDFENEPEKEPVKKEEPAVNVPDVPDEDFSDEAPDYESMTDASEQEEDGRLFTDEFTTEIEEVYRQDFYRSNFSGLTEAEMKLKAISTYENELDALYEYADKLKDGEVVDFAALEIALGRERVARFFCDDEADDDGKLTGVDFNFMLSRAKEDHTFREALLGVKKTGTDSICGPKPLIDIVSAFLQSYRNR